MCGTSSLPWQYIIVHCGIEWVLHPFLAVATTTQLIQSKHIVTVAVKQGLNTTECLKLKKIIKCVKM